MIFKYREFYKILRAIIMNKVTFVTVIIKGTGGGFSQMWTVKEWNTK